MIGSSTHSLLQNSPSSSFNLKNQISAKQQTLCINSSKSPYPQGAKFIMTLLKTPLMHNTSSNPKKKRTTKIYNHPYCIPCLYLDNNTCIEDTEHIFTDCPHYAENYNHLYSQIMNVINKTTKPETLNHIPAWFHSKDKSMPYNHAERGLSNFPKHLGDQGYIPKDIKTLIKHYYPKLKQKKKLLKKIALTTQTFVHKKWTQRCDLHFTLIKSPFVYPYGVLGLVALRPMVSPLPPSLIFISPQHNQHILSTRRGAPR